MTAELSNLINKLNKSEIREADVILWGCPVPSFGNLLKSEVATLGLNPSNREFVNPKGEELVGTKRRFHTLNSLGISQWSEVTEYHIKLIINLCNEYFNNNPYDGWFKKLDYIISGTQTSYYFPSGNACHLDLIPFATVCKWSDLTSRQRSILLEYSGDTLGLLIKKSPIKLIVLNGKTVVENFEFVAKVTLSRELMPDWTLPRNAGKGVAGFAYTGFVESIGEVKLDRKLMVLGYNHNLQSSFGVTKKVQTAIRNWVTQKAINIF